MAAYPERLLVRGERVLEHHRPHWRMLVVPVLLPPLLALPAGFTAALVSAEPWRAVVWAVLGVLAGGLAVWFALVPLARWHCTHLVVTDRRVLVREGVLSRSTIDLPASEITAVRLRQTVLERTLGCGTLVVATAGTADGDRWEFDGIPHLARVAATLDEVAEERGGFEPDELDEPEILVDADPDRDDPDRDDLDAEPDDERGGARGRPSRLPALRHRGPVARVTR